MNRDYSKFLELINQDAEKERNKKAEKAVHDNLYNKGFRDGVAILDKIRTEIESITPKAHIRTGKLSIDTELMIPLDRVLKVLDKYKTESEENE